MVFFTESDAANEIQKLQQSYQRSYFDGSFQAVQDGVFIYEFKGTMAASNAKESWFPVKFVTCVPIAEIAPPCHITISLNLDIVMISRSEMIEVALSAIEDAGVEEPVKKKFKECMQSRGFYESPVRPVVTTADELGVTKHLYQQLIIYAKKFNFKIFANVSSISSGETRNFSKYSSSRPDLTIYPNVIVLNQRYGKCLLVLNNDDGKLEEAMGALSLTIEAKMSCNNNVLGQLFACMEKTYTDLFWEAMNCARETQVFDKVIMYGMYLMHERSECNILKAILKLNSQTTVYKTTENLHINDAISRIFNQLSAKGTAFLFFLAA